MAAIDERHINYQRIEQAILYLEKNFQRQPELNEVAEHVHLSPFHFQRIFTEWAGISPKRFLQYLTVDFLKEALHKSRNLSEAADQAGLSGQSRVYDLFTTLEAVTPQEYKQRGGLTIRYGVVATLFGPALLGISERGVCWLSFLAVDEDPRRELEKMKEHWHRSTFFEDQELAAAYAGKIFSPKTGAPYEAIHLYVKGTNFQIKVWEALLRLPAGNVTTYQAIAGHIENPKALQAVGSAVGANHLAYIIPCHRVIRKDGILGEYRWSAARKKSIIGWEMAQANHPLTP